MFDNWNENAIRILMRAQEEGRLMGHAFIGTEQLFLGLVADGTRNIASQFLKEKGFDIYATRSAVQKVIGRGSSTDFIQMPFTPRMKHVLGIANEVAEKFSESRVGPEHLLLAMFMEGEGIAMQTIEPSRRLTLRDEFKTFTSSIKGVLLTERSEVINNPQTTSNDINEIMDDLALAHDDFVGSIQKISELVDSIETPPSECVQHSVFVVRGTEVRRFLINEDERKSWVKAGVQFFETESDANDYLFNKLGDRLYELYSLRRQAGV